MEFGSSHTITIYSEILSSFNIKPIRNLKILDIIGNKNYVCYSEETRLLNQADHVSQGMIKDKNIKGLASKLIDSYRSMGYKNPNFQLKNYEKPGSIGIDCMVDPKGMAYVISKGVSDREASDFIDAIRSMGPNVEWENARKSICNP